MKTLKHLFSVLFLTAFVASCGVSDADEQRLKDELRAEMEAEQQDDASQADADMPFQANVSISKSPSDVSFEGSVVHKISWKDKNGENLALFTKTEDRLWVYHYAFPKGVAKLIRKVQDNELDCPLDMSLFFVNESITVTDLDANNLGELSFMYKKGCRGDVRPLDVKLLLIENGDKYIMRGTESLELGEYIEKGTKNVTSSFTGGPKAFLTHANGLWGRYEKGSF